MLRRLIELARTGLEADEEAALANGDELTMCHRKEVNELERMLIMPLVRARTDADMVTLTLTDELEGLL